MLPETYATSKCTQQAKNMQNLTRYSEKTEDT